MSREWHCAAYPKRIPIEIIHSVWDHREPQNGDHGILYSPISDEFVLPENLGQGEWVIEIDKPVLY